MVIYNTNVSRDNLQQYKLLEMIRAYSRASRLLLQDRLLAFSMARCLSSRSTSCSPSSAAPAGTFVVCEFVAGALRAQSPLLQHLPDFSPLLQRCLTKALKNRMEAPGPLQLPPGPQPPAGLLAGSRE